MDDDDQRPSRRHVGVAKCWRRRAENASAGYVVYSAQQKSRRYYQRLSASLPHRTVPALRAGNHLPLDASTAA